MLRGAEKLVPAEYWFPYGTIARINTIRHLCCTRTLINVKRNKIDKNLIPLMTQILFFFFLLAKINIASVRPTRNMFFILKTILVRDTIAQLIRSAKLLLHQSCALLRMV